MLDLKVRNEVMKLLVEFFGLLPHDEMTAGVEFPIGHIGEETVHLLFVIGFKAAVFSTHYKRRNTNLMVAPEVPISVFDKVRHGAAGHITKGVGHGGKCVLSNLLRGVGS